ncbi:dolicholphosphate-mannose synthase, putative [Trypanosoma cruzi marinkellei]|uniref:Dolicholphosphate-mannose synthase, putative n=1 Tax=Trypanosoma cruzi marinkellei TaxID=85056 RepID=K2MKW9_TRYCR|nr:dolicholphosphate-mannose synthase, putative [Trypanosoma cruzi marinkellei]
MKNFLFFSFFFTFFSSLSLSRFTLSEITSAPLTPAPEGDCTNKLFCARRNLYTSLFLSFFLIYLCVSYLFIYLFFFLLVCCCFTTRGRRIISGHPAHMSIEPDHWSFFQLPPFFALQPGPTALARQTSLWGNAIIDHAAYHAPMTRPGVCPFLRLYKSTSDVFRNPSLNRRLPPEAATRMLESLVTQHPNHCAVVLSGDEKGENDGTEFAVLLACNESGLKGLEQALLSWILDRGAGTTTAHLAQKGVVMTFDELAESNCLAYRRDREPFLNRLSAAPVPVGDVGALSDEQAIRTLLHSLKSRPLSSLSPIHITLFNMDGSDRQPYEGVKFGGAVAS